MNIDLSKYDDKIEALFRVVPSFQRVGKAGYNPGIEKMMAFDDFLGNPHRRYRVIHVAGTNGKGSVSSMLASVLMGLGYRVGLYTSPHLVDFRERIKVDGQMIEKGAVLEFLERCERFVDEYRPSFFEITTAMAFDYFAAREVDYAVVECGLGGRLDSTNIVTPVLSVITSIGLDHTDILGDTLEKVAYEKGGIIKRGVPVVVGDVPESVEGVLRGIASERGADMYCAQYVDGSPEMLAGKINPSHTCGAGPSHSRCHGRHVFPLPTSQVEDILSRMDLKGDYQRSNLMTVLTSLELLSVTCTPSTIDSICHAAQRTGFRGRWEVLSERPFIVCDIAHNPHGMAPVMEQLKRVYQEAVTGGTSRLFIIFGVMGDKDLESISDYLPHQAYYFYTAADSPRAMDPYTLSEWMSGHGFIGEVTSGVAEAVKNCLSQVTEEDIVYIGGSSYVVAEALKLF